MRGNFNMLFRIAVHLGVPDELLVSKIRITMRVFLQMYRGFLEKKYV